MNSSRIEELKRKRQAEYKNKKNQQKLGFGFLLVVLMLWGFLANYSQSYAAIWIIGLFIGFTLQRSKFCFTASFRDPILVGSTSLLKAIIVAFFISTIGFAVIQYQFISEFGLDIAKIPGQIEPVGLHTAIGAILFGIGMVIAGGCASGTLMRIGEGFLLQLVVLTGFIIGTLFGAKDFEFWDNLLISKSKIIYLPNYLGFWSTVVIQLTMLGILYYLADLYDKKNSIMVK